MTSIRRQSVLNLIGPILLLALGQGACVSRALAPSDEEPDLVVHEDMAKTLAECPELLPEDGQPCALENAFGHGVQCHYTTACGEAGASCSGGHWGVSGATNCP